MGSYSDESYSSYTPTSSRPSRPFFKPAPSVPKPTRTKTKPAVTKTRKAAKVKAPVATKIVRPKGKINVVLGFDTTGSMGNDRENLKAKAKYFYEEITKLLPDLAGDMEVSFVGIGDHCDGSLMIQATAFSNDVNTLVCNIDSIENTHGGDTPEAYECLFKIMNSWDIENTNTVFILVADSIPHGMGFLEDDGCPDGVNYAIELEALKKKLKAFYFVSLSKSSVTKRYQKKLVDDEEHYIELGNNFWRLTNLVHGIIAKELEEIEQYFDHLKKTRGDTRVEEIKTLLKTKI